MCVTSSQAHAFDTPSDWSLGQWPHSPRSAPWQPDAAITIAATEDMPTGNWQSLCPSSLNFKLVYWRVGPQEKEDPCPTWAQAAPCPLHTATPRAK